MSDAELERDLQQLSGVAAGRAWTERVHVCGERDGGERRGEEKIKVHGVRGWHALPFCSRVANHSLLHLTQRFCRPP